MACSPRWIALKRAFSSFLHLGLLQIPRLSNFKEICLQNRRIIVFTRGRLLPGKLTRGNRPGFYEPRIVVMHDGKRSIPLKKKKKEMLFTVINETHFRDFRVMSHVSISDINLGVPFVNI